VQSREGGGRLRKINWREQGSIFYRKKGYKAPTPSPPEENALH